jgi:ubiquinone/menaquinone biosynthesis C-methylase UbiE
MTTANAQRPGLVGRFRSRQSGHPTGLIGRIFGRAMVKDTAAANDRAIELLDLHEPATVLEIGFGQGRTAAVLLGQGHRVFGVDRSPTMVAQATARNRTACRDGRATFVHGDGITIPFPDHSVDAAFTVHTIYFMPDPTATLTDIARVLRPGGRLVIACRTSDTPLPAWMDPGIYRVPTLTQLHAMLDAASPGYTDIAHHIAPAAGHDLHLVTAHSPDAARASS